MAKNVARPKQSNAKEEAKVQTRNTPNAGKQLSFDFVAFSRSREFHLGIGVFLMMMGVFLGLAMLSYLFTGTADQSVVQSAFNTSLQESGQEVRNIFGLFGAYIAHKFIFSWFGIASLLVMPLLIFAGIKITFNKEYFPLKNLTYQVIFYLIWISALMGFVVKAADLKGSWSWLSGGFGYELNTILHNVIGWFSILIIGFALFLWVIYFYKITSIDQILDKMDSPNFNKNIEEDDDEDEERVSSQKPSRSSVLTKVEDEEIDEDAIIKARVSSLAAEAAKAFNQEITPTETPKKGLDFAVNYGTPETEQEETDEPSEIENIVMGAMDDQSERLLKEFGLYDPTLDLPHYQYPTVDLLEEYRSGKVQVTPEELESNKNKIVNTLGEFGIGIAKIEATVGPTVTLYEIIPDAGVRISKIKNLEDDIALKLAALGIRIIAPIPGKGTIGIEVPNKNRETVSIRGLIASDKFQKSTADLPVVLGKTISNEIFLTDLARMPHLLMAGATGQGKSVGLNVILASLLYKKHPSQLKFVLVDPKKVELTLFNTIERHFLATLPNTAEAIITDTKKVIHTLNSLCIEMDMRYNLLKEAGCRNLKEYNVKFVNRRLNPEKGHKFMPYIVLVIDELADLMMTAGKEVEQPIARLAQLARAIGIHLVVATQRPSVNVITGIIKANFPARLSFKVTAKVDSRTILDTGGAEQLVGMGDMLLSQGSDVIRLQCAFVDTPEVERICEFIGSQKGYDSAYLLPEFEGDESGAEASDFDPNDLDPLFDDAARLLVMHQQGSTSLIQRRLKLGYNRAGRLIDQLEKMGIVGAFEGSKAREVLVKSESELEEILKRK